MTAEERILEMLKDKPKTLTLSQGHTATIAWGEPGSVYQVSITTPVSPEEAQELAERLVRATLFFTSGEGISPYPGTKLEGSQLAKALAVFAANGKEQVTQAFVSVDSIIDGYDFKGNFVQNLGVAGSSVVLAEAPIEKVSNLKIQGLVVDYHTKTDKTHIYDGSFIKEYIDFAGIKANKAQFDGENYILYQDDTVVATIPKLTLLAGDKPAPPENPQYSDQPELVEQIIKWKFNNVDKKLVLSIKPTPHKDGYHVVVCPSIGKQDKKETYFVPALGLVGKGVGDDFVIQQSEQQDSYPQGLIDKLLYQHYVEDVEAAKKVIDIWRAVEEQEWNKDYEFVDFVTESVAYHPNGYSIKQMENFINQDILKSTKPYWDTIANILANYWAATNEVMQDWKQEHETL